ncbi:MAG: single-stranded DNA-binding protein [Clostridia bacterium]
MNTVTSNNTVTLSGRVVGKPEYSHEVFGEKFYDVKLDVKRLSDMSDILPITVSERTMLTIPFATGDYVTVEGQFRSYNKLVDDKSKLMLTVFVRSAEASSESVSVNKIELNGFLCKNPIFRTTPFNREICDMLLAVNRAYSKSDYIPCIAWGRNARFVKLLPVGQKMTIIGRVQSRVYQKKLSETQVDERVAYEVSISKIVTEKQELEVASTISSRDSEQLDFNNILNKF